MPTTNMPDTINFVDSFLTPVLLKELMEAPTVARSPSEVKPNALKELAAMLHEPFLHTKEALNADRLSIFLFDREKCELWSILSQEKKIMRLDARLGVAGHVAMTGETARVANAQESSLFYKDVDLATNYHTGSLLAVPLKDTDGKVIGVGEAINKSDGPFTVEDEKLLQQFAETVARKLTPLLPTIEPPPFAELPTQQLVGMSPAVQGIIRAIDQSRECSIDVLIQGESGTGKELVARAIHESSPRANKPFIAVNCAAILESMVDSELSGVEDRRATGVDAHMGKFEAANGGTIFLDEIGDLSPNAQAKILRILQEREVVRVGSNKPIPLDVRVISATNKDLLQEIKDRTFRKDLYFRLKVLHIVTVPLREVPEDIPQIACHFLDKHCKALGREPKMFSPNALQALTQYPWAGNSRELENEIKRLVASVRARKIQKEDLALEIQFPNAGGEAEPVKPMWSNPAPPSPAQGPRTLAEELDALARKRIEETLKETHGNKQQAAKNLGLSRAGLIKMMKRLGVG